MNPRVGWSQRVGRAQCVGWAQPTNPVFRILALLASPVFRIPALLPRHLRWWAEPTLLLALAGCAPSSTSTFSMSADSGLVWPPPPDPPRIRYVGEIVGEASLGRAPTLGESLRAVVAGPAAPLAFATPLAVAVAGERVFVADPGQANGPCVHVLDLAARTHAVLQKIGATPLAWPIDVAAHGSKLAIADAKNAVVYLIEGGSAISEGGANGATFGQGLFKRPASVAWSNDGNTLFVLDASAAAIHEFSADGRHLRSFGARGSGDGQFNLPAGLCIANRTPSVSEGPATMDGSAANTAGLRPNGRVAEARGQDARTTPTQNVDSNLVVADSMNFRVQVLNDNGAAVAAFGGKGDAAGKFALPRDIASDSAGNLYVLDNQFENVQVFDPSGQLLMAFGGEGRGAGQFNLPSGITIDERDRIWIADTYNRRVQVFQAVKSER